MSNKMERKDITQVAKPLVRLYRDGKFTEVFFFEKRGEYVSVENLKKVKTIPESKAVEYYLSPEGEDRLNKIPHLFFPSVKLIEVPSVFPPTYRFFHRNQEKIIYLQSTFQDGKVGEPVILKEVYLNRKVKKS